MSDMRGDCSHKFVTRLTADGGEVRLWTCFDCRRRFYPACPVCVDVGHRNEAHPAEWGAALRSALDEHDRLTAAVQDGPRGQANVVVAEALADGGETHTRDDNARSSGPSWTAGLREEIWAAIDKLPTVPVEWAPAHSAPYVSRDLAQAVVSALLASPVDRERTTGHPEAYCHRCGGWNLGGWHAPSPVWNAVMRRHDGPEPFDGIICPQCFEQLAEQFGVIDTERTGWHVHPDPFPDVPMTDADGRAWDAEQCLWIDQRGAGRVPATSEGVDALQALSWRDVGQQMNVVLLDDALAVLQAALNVVRRELTAEADGYLALLWKANASLGEALQRGIELNDRRMADHALRSLLAVGRLFGWDEAGSPKPDRTPEQAATEARAAAVLIAEGYITQAAYDWSLDPAPQATDSAESVDIPERAP